MLSQEKIDQVIMESHLAIPIKDYLSEVDECWNSEELLRDEVKCWEKRFLGEFNFEEEADKFIVESLNLSGKEAEEYLEHKHENYLYLVAGMNPTVYLFDYQIY